MKHLKTDFVRNEQNGCRLRMQWWQISVKKKKKKKKKTPNTNAIFEWKKEVWFESPLQIIVRSFKKCFITNAMDGIENDVLFEKDGNDDELDRDDILSDLQTKRILRNFLKILTMTCTINDYLWLFFLIVKA